jgi:hypothetical protein
MVALVMMVMPMAIPGFAAPATADTYQVLACSQAPNGANNSWQPFDSDPTYLTTGEVCPPQVGSTEQAESTGMFATDVLGSSGAAPDGAVAGERFIAPAGTDIVDFQDDRFIGAYADNGWKPFVKADNAILETCTFTVMEEGCSVGEPFGSGSLNGILQVDEAETLTVGIECVAAGGCTTGSTLHRAWAALYGAKVTLSELAPPSIATPSGSLWEPGPAGGFHKGIEQVSFKASDLTGIAQASISIDGHVVASQQGTCDYTMPLPCQPLSPVFEVDTSQLSDGPHTVVLAAVDAAGNETQATEQIVVANQPPEAPVGLKAVTQSNGTFLVSWSDPAHVAPIVGADYQLCPAVDGACNGATATGNSNSITLPASVAGQTVRVWLTDAAGNSSSANAASVALPVTPTSTGLPAGTSNVPALRLKHSLRGRRLTIVVIVPSGVPGPIQLGINVLRGKKHVLSLKRRVKVKRGRVQVVFVLSRTALSATRLAIMAGAKGAASAVQSLVLPHRTTHRARH